MWNWAALTQRAPLRVGAGISPKSQFIGMPVQGRLGGIMGLGLIIFNMASSATWAAQGTGPTQWGPDKTEKIFDKKNKAKTSNLPNSSANAPVPRAPSRPGVNSGLAGGATLPTGQSVEKNGGAYAPESLKSASRSVAMTGFANGIQMPEMAVQANQAYLIDLSTRAVLLEKNSDQSMAPSSMTKIVTVYLIFQALAQKSLDWSEGIYVSENAAKKPGSRMFIKAGESVKVEDLLKGIVVTSGNDACTAVAEFLGGSEEGFSEMMNALAANIGMNDSHFSNASGLPGENHYSTCKDLAKIAEQTLVDFPKEYAKFYKMTSFKYNGIAQPNRNGLLKNGFADGMKTGMTDAGKYGIVASMKCPGHPERRLLLVLNGVKTSNLREAEARRLLNWGSQRFESLIVEKGRVMATLPLWKEGSVGLATQSRLAVTLPKGSLRRATIVVRYHQPMTPPIQKNQRLGVLVIEIPGQKTIEMPLVAEKDALAPGIWDWIMGWFKK